MKCLPTCPITLCMFSRPTSCTYGRSSWLFLFNFDLLMLFLILFVFQLIYGFFKVIVVLDRKLVWFIGREWKCTHTGKDSAGCGCATATEAIGCRIIGWLEYVMNGFYFTVLFLFYLCEWTDIRTCRFPNMGQKWKSFVDGKSRVMNDITKLNCIHLTGFINDWQKG